MKLLATNFFLYGSYYLFVALTVLTGYWLHRLAVESGFSWKTFLRQERVPLLAALVLAGLVVSTVTPRYRTLSDEANLVTVSQSFLNEKSAQMIYGAKKYYGIWFPASTTLPNRPLLYPYLVSLGHLVSGERLANAFAVNAILLFGVLALTLVVFRRRGAIEVGLGVVFLALSHPILKYCATSAGFDFLAMSFFAFSVAMLGRLMVQPTIATAGAFLCVLALFSHCRYESIGVAGILALGALAVPTVRQIPWRPLVPTVIFLVFAASPLLLQQLLIENRTLVPSSGVEPFSVVAATQNSWDFVRFLLLFERDDYMPYSIVAIWAGILGAGTILMFARRPSHLLPAEKGRAFWGVVLAAWVIVNALYLSHYKGNLRSLTEARFYLSLLAGLALIPGLALMRLPDRFGSLRARGSVFAGLCLALFVFEHPTAVEQRYSKLLFIIRETETIKERIPRLQPDPPLIVHVRSNIFTSDGYSGLDFDYVNSHVDEVVTMVRRRLIPRAYVVQRIRYVDQGMEHFYHLDPRIPLKEVFTFQLNADEYTRVSEITP